MEPLQNVSLSSIQDRIGDRSLTPQQFEDEFYTDQATISEPSNFLRNLANPESASVLAGLSGDNLISMEDFRVFAGLGNDGPFDTHSNITGNDRSVFGQIVNDQ
ncbi:MAG: hypothetical protein SFZ03_09210 [Candidatus Melainabacteria bacterium]|nr:hypothetical protein [Candidatus Melainabacteria bacterium]